MIETFHWMKPLMNYSFPLGLSEISLYPTMSSRRRFRILIQTIQETPEHLPDAYPFFDLIWLLTCEYCACEITSGYCTMSLRFFWRLCPKCLKQHIIKISPNDGARLFRRQHFHGAHNRIHLSTDHTMLVSRLYCLEKQFTDYRNNNHCDPLRSQLLYSLGHLVGMPHDKILFSEWSGAVEPILFDWCNEEHYINTDGSVGNSLNLDIQVIEQMRDNVIFALQDEHIKENAELAHVFPNIKKHNFNVLYCQDVRMVHQDAFMGNNRLNFFAALAIQQIDYCVPGTIQRFHTLEYGFMNHLYYHTPHVRNVYRYNSVRRWVKDINLLDYDYVFIPTNNNESQCFNQTSSTNSLSTSILSIFNKGWVAIETNMNSLVDLING
jgi:hypothetical protein